MSRTTVIISDSSEMNSESTLCRLCIKNNDSCFSIFTSNVTCEMPVKDVLQDLVGLQVALGDGLPGVICPLCLKKLMEFRDFKRICFESDAELRKCPSRNCFKSIKEERTADDNMGSSTETKECIADTIEGTAQFTCSVQRTEIYIPLENCQLPTANIMFNVKEENEQLLSGGNYPASNSPNTAGISSEASDPLATHDLCTVKEENEQLFSGGNYPAFNSPNTAGISSEASDPLATDDLPTFTKDGKPIGNCKMTNVSTMEATWLSTPDKVMMERTSTSCMMKEKVLRIGNSDDCIAPSVSVTHIQSQTVSSHGEEGSNVRDEDLEEGSAPHALKILSNSIPDDGQSYMIHIRVSKNSETGATMNVFGGIGDAPNITDSLRLIRVSENRRSGIDDVMADKKEISYCFIKNPSNGKNSNEKLNYCSHCRYGFSTNDDLIKHMEIHSGSSNLDLNDESFMEKDESFTFLESREESSNSCESSTTSETLIGLKRKRQGPMQKVNTSVIKISGGIVEEKTVGQGRSSDGNRKPHTLNTSSKSTCARNLRNHTLGGTKRGPFNCNASSSQGSSLSNHTHAHTERKCYQCRICSKSFTTKSDLAQHMQIHTGEKTYSCNECTESFSTEDSFILHIETHTKETPYTCNICSKNFAQCSSLNAHMCTRPDSKPFSCDDCSKSFSRKSGLVKHLRTHNTGERPYACNYCAKSFTRNDSFTKHLRVHTGEKPYSCSDCAKSFSTRDSLILHLHTHAEVKPFSCNDCAKSFSRKRDLVIHLRTHTGERPYSCKHCAKSFNQSGHLNQHVRTHTGEKPHSCNYCAKSFSRKDHLVLHLLTHTGEKRYSCNICEKSFSQNSTLHKHMRVHSGEKPHCCTFCAKSFTKKVSLTKHTRTHLVEKL